MYADGCLANSNTRHKQEKHKKKPPLHFERIGFFAVQHDVESMCFAFRLDFHRRDHADEPKCSVCEAEGPNAAYEGCRNLFLGRPFPNWFVETLTTTSRSLRTIAVAVSSHEVWIQGVASAVPLRWRGPSEHL